MKVRRILEWLAIIYLYQLMLLAGYAFLNGSDAVYITFAVRTGLRLTAEEFALLSWVGALVAPLILLIPRKESIVRASLYVACALPIAFYTVPFGFWLVDNAQFGLSILIYIDFFVSFVIIGGAIFQPGK